MAKCVDCLHYPNDCGYWDKNFRNKKENKNASFLSETHEHNCQDFSSNKNIVDLIKREVKQ